MNTLVKVVWIISALTLSFSDVYATPVPPGPPILNIVNSASTNDACQGSVSELQAVIGSYFTTEFQVGNSGPRGGLISYDKGNDNEGWRYLQIAPYDIVLPNSLIAGFGCECQNVNAFGEVPGSGYENFQAWVNSPCANEWLQYLDTLHILGFDDWYIPSLSELTSIYGQLSNQSINYIEPLNPDFYWTSSAANYGSCGTSGGIYQLSMQSGTTSIVDRNFSLGRIRLVRRFSNIPSYLWNTGSTESSIQITNADAGYNTYSVQVNAFLNIIKSQFGGIYNSEIANASIQIYVYPNIQVSSNTIFAGDSVLINGIYRKEAGVFSDTFTTAQGCDSVVVVNLVVIQPEIDCRIGVKRENNQWRLSLPFFDPEGPGFAGNTSVYNWSNGANSAFILVGQNGSGVYSVSVTNGNRSCEASIGLNLNLPSSTTIDTTLSAGQSIAFNGQNLNQSGTYAATFQNAAGCDSVVTLNLIVNQIPDTLNCTITSNDFEICQGDFTSLTVSVDSGGTTETESWTLVGQLPEPRASASGYIHDGKIWIHAGSNFFENRPESMYFDLGTTTGGLSGNIPFPRGEVGFGRVNDKFYVIGGYTGSTASNNTQEFDIQTGIWASKASMPSSRSVLSSATLDDKIYVLGGWPGTLNTFERYSPATNSWETLPNIPTARHSVNSATAIDNKIYFLSGKNDIMTQFYNANECFDPVSNTWSVKTPVPQPVYGGAVASFNGKIYLVGGSTGTYGQFASGNQTNYKTVQIYDPVSDTWSMGPEIPIATSLGLLISDGISLYFIGGLSKPNSGGALFVSTAIYRLGTQQNSILWSTGETTPSISVSPSQTTTYSVTVTQNGQICTSEVTINVNQPTTSTTSVSSCQPYTWNGNTYTQSGIYTWTGTSASDCDSTATLNLTVNSSPNVSFEPDNTTYCNNSGSVELSGGSPAGGVYSGPGVSNGEFNPTTAGSGFHPISYTYTNANGCSGSETVAYEVAVCTGVEAATQPVLEVRPNPMESSTWVSLKNYTGNDAQFNLLLMDATGRKVFEKQISADVIREGYQLLIPELASGTYVLMLSNAHYSGVKRLVK